MSDNSAEFDQLESYRHRGRDWSQSWVMIAMWLVICLLVWLVWYLSRNNLINPSSTQQILINLDQPRQQSWINNSWAIATWSLNTWSINTGLINTGTTTGMIDTKQLERIITLMWSTEYLRKMTDPQKIQWATKQLSINPQDNKLESPSLQLQWITDQSIQKITIIHLDGQGILQAAYALTKFKPGDETRTTNLSPNNGNIKPWPNRYFIIGTDADGINHVATIVLTAPTGEVFEREWTRRCLMDVCTDPNIKLTKQADGSFTQRTTTRTITYKTDEMIEIKSLVNNELTSVIRVDNNILIKKKGTLHDGIDAIAFKHLEQKIQTTYGEPITTLSDISIPKSITYGNISYTNPVISFSTATDTIIYTKQAMQNMTPQQALSSFFIQETSVIYPSFIVEVAKDIYVQYTLSRHQWNVFDPTIYDSKTNKLTSFRIIPKLASWMSWRMPYAIIEPDMEQIIIQQVWPVEKQSNCNIKKYSMVDKPDVKFVIYPINNKYDIVMTTNCRWVIKS